MVLHVQALLVTLGLMASVLLLISGVTGAKAVFGAFVLMSCYIAYQWIKDTVGQMTKTNRHGLMLGVFGVAMFLFSYAMVPLYHLLCHGGSSVEAGVSGHPLEANIMVERYRTLPVKVSASERKLSLVRDKQQVVYFDLENLSHKPVEMKLVVASQPRTLKPYFNLVTPDVIELRPRQKTRFPVAVRLDDNVPDDLWQTALLFVFQDTKSVGELGKSPAWQKMHGKGERG